MKFIKFTTLFLLLFGSVGFAEEFEFSDSREEVQLYVTALSTAIYQTRLIIDGFPIDNALKFSLKTCISNLETLRSNVSSMDGSFSDFIVQEFGKILELVGERKSESDYVDANGEIKSTWKERWGLDLYYSAYTSSIYYDHFLRAFLNELKQSFPDLHQEVISKYVEVYFSFY
jgi:hypothetical protein